MASFGFHHHRSDMFTTLQCRYFQRGFGYSVPIGALAGLIGLGGGEFRLPVLTQLIGYPPRAAIPINLLISLATLAVALAFRNYAVPASSLAAHIPEVIGLTLGGVLSAYYGTKLVVRMSNRRLNIVMAFLLCGIGALLLAEAVVPLGTGALGQQSDAVRAVAGALVGIAVGIVSSMLGVAGGELLIPALIFLFGADIRVAGSASLLISLAIVATGLWRYHQAGALRLSGSPIRIATGMSAGSAVGAFLGALAVSFAPVAALKIVLGSVLIAAAWKTISHNKREA